MTPEYLAKPLTPFPLPTTDGLMLRTIGDIGAYILALPKRRKRLAHWEQVRRLIVKQAGGATVTQQVRHALSKDDKLDLVAFESITSARRWRSAQKLEEENDPRARRPSRLPTAVTKTTIRTARCGRERVNRQMAAQAPHGVRYNDQKSDRIIARRVILGRAKPRDAGQFFRSGGLRTNCHQQAIAGLPCNHRGSAAYRRSIRKNVVCAYGITRAELLRRLALALVETIKGVVDVHDVLPREIFFPHPLHRCAPWNLSSERTFIAWANKFDTIWTYGGSAFPPPSQMPRPPRHRSRAGQQTFFPISHEGPQTPAWRDLPEPWILGGPARPALPASLRRK